MKKYLRLLFSFSFVFIALSSSAFAQTSESSQEISAKIHYTYAQKKYHRQLNKMFSRYAESLGLEVAVHEEFLKAAGQAKKDPFFRKTFLDEYLLQLQDELAARMEKSSSREVKAAAKELEADFNRQKRAFGGEQRLLQQYVDEQTLYFNRDLDQLYRDMILELERNGHYEFARLMMDLKKSVTKESPKDEFNALMSISGERLAHLELDQRIEKAGGIEAFKRELEMEREANRKWKCIAGKMAVSASLAPLAAITLFLGYNAAPIVAGYVTLKTSASLVGSYAFLRLDATAVKKVIRGCYREIHENDSIDGLIHSETQSQE